MSIDRKRSCHIIARVEDSYHVEFKNLSNFSIVCSPALVGTTVAVQPDRDMPLAVKTQLV